MKTIIEINLKPFRTPSYVLTDSIPQAPCAPGIPTSLPDESRLEPPKYRLDELSVETLNDLCDQFRDDVFRKAGVAPKPIATDEDATNNI